MAILVLGLTLFIGTHLLREIGLRRVLMAKIPQAAYVAAYSLLALTGLGLIVWGKASAPFVMLWQPLFAMQWITLLLMIPAFILVLAGNLPTSYMRAQVRNPMVLGVTLWAAAHLWSNGDLASVLLFGSFCVWGIIKLVSLRSQYDHTRKPLLKWDGVAILAGFSTCLVVMIFHGQLFGVGVLSIG